MMQEGRNDCVVCNNVAKQRCSGCQAVYYCSEKHQKTHWKIHAKNCRAYKLVENSQIGKHYVATRNIKVGELVLHDKTPLVTIPGHLTAIRKEDGSYRLSIASPPICLGCYVGLAACNAKPCVKCGWPLCHTCTKHGTECEFTIKHRTSKVNILKTEYGQPHPAYEIIGVIRALVLRDNNPKAYQKLMNVQDNSSKMERELELWNSIEKAAQFVKTFFNIENVEKEEICKLIRILLIAAYKANGKYPQAQYAVVYDHSSYMEHNCRPNCTKTFTSEDSIRFWAAVPISKGDHITTSYVNPRWGTKKRREYLSGTKFFDCTCERCSDPTEFGTMFNAIKCTEDACNGYAVPPTFLVTGGKYADFVCRQCNTTVPRNLSDLLERGINLERSILQMDIDQCRKFIEKWSEFFHENNSYIYDAEIKLVGAIAYANSGLQNKSEEYLTDMIKLCTKLSERVQILAPADYALRGTLLYLKLQAAMISHRSKSLTIDEKLACAKKFQKDLDRVYEFLHLEPAGVRYETSMSSVRGQLQKLESIEKFLLLNACSNK